MSRLKSCQFKETAKVANGARTYYISVTGVTVAAPNPGAEPTRVAGPKVKWQSAAAGLTGAIAPGTFG